MKYGYKFKIGSTKYFGDKCRVCGGALRFIANDECVTCHEREHGRNERLKQDGITKLDIDRRRSNLKKDLDRIEKEYSLNNLI
jgi:hypothetical protein